MEDLLKRKTFNIIMKSDPERRASRRNSRREDKKYPYKKSREMIVFRKIHQIELKD